MYYTQNLPTQTLETISQAQAAIQKTHQTIPITAIYYTPFPYILPDNNIGCTVTIVTSQGYYFSHIGVVAYTDAKGWDGTFQEAFAIATLRTLNRINSCFNSQPIIDVPSHLTGIQQGANIAVDMEHVAHSNIGLCSQPAISQIHHKDKSRFNGGGNKAASSKQLEFAQDLARKRGFSLDTLAQERFGKQAKALIGAEVQQIINELKFC